MTRTPVARGVDASDSALDSGSEDTAPDSAADSTDTSGGTVTLVYDTPDQTLRGSGAFGCDVASGGDIDGDGYDDLVVANDWSGTDDRFWIAGGSPAGLSATVEFPLPNNVAAWSMTGPVAIVGDTNGDGFDDMVASGYWCPGSASFRVGSCVGLAGGFSNGAAGDVNGDGYDDAVFGYVTRDDEWDIGHVYIFDGGPDGMTEDAVYLGAYDADSGRGEHFGWAVAGGMDLNGDGYSDVLGIGYADARVFYGSSTGFPGGDSVDGQSLGECSQCEANNAGDVDGDGYDEVAVLSASVDVFHGSAIGVDTTNVDHREGLSYANSAGDVNDDDYADMLLFTSRGTGLYFGGPGGTSSTPAMDLRSEDPANVFTAGDVDGDGIPDMIGGAPYSGVDPWCGGCVYLWLGSTITDPSRASTDTGGDSGSDTHSGGEPDSGSDSAPAPDSDSAADSGAADTAAARKTGCGRGCAAVGGGADLAGGAFLLVAFVCRRSVRG